MDLHTQYKGRGLKRLDQALTYADNVKIVLYYLNKSGLTDVIICRGHVPSILRPVMVPAPLHGSLPQLLPCCCHSDHSGIDSKQLTDENLHFTFWMLTVLNEPQMGLNSSYPQHCSFIYLFLQMACKYVPVCILLIMFVVSGKLYASGVYFSCTDTTIITHKANVFCVVLFIYSLNCLYCIV